MEKEYYERYWKKETLDEQGFVNAPPKHSDHEISKTMDILRPYVSGCVLDVGCGDGFVTRAISKLPGVMEVHGVDISDTAIRVAKSKYPHIDFKVGQVANLPFERNYFDVVVAIELIEHIYDTEQMFREFSRVLKDAGHLIITTTDFNLPKKVIIALFFWNRYFYPTNPHIRFFSKKSLETMLIKFGFRRVAYRWNGSYFGMMPKGQIMIAKKTKFSVSAR
ncbi:MAG: class I SAM-dependent methyltransferase [Candidatus Bathyarchaeia archaeon]|jgi:2-polyprenyl-3-methyl-5-hydroxy-6-metoxy-1,4-benzoquinol methylase